MQTALGNAEQRAPAAEQRAASAEEAAQAANELAGAQAPDGARRRPYGGKGKTRRIDDAQGPEGPSEQRWSLASRYQREAFTGESRD